MELPAAFEKRMQDMLGAEYTAFRASYNEPHKRGIRLNTVKCTKEQLECALPFTLVQTPFSPLSFYAPTDTKMAALPLYHAGAFYSQEPSASSAVTLLAPEPGDKVLDLCAAPGGKSTQIAALTGSHRLSFFDAVAPIVSAESLDMEKIFAASRYGRGEADYLNCPFNKLEYETFYNELLNAERAPLHDFDGELTVYEGCMPIEVMAGRGADTMRYGPLRPVGLRDPRTGHRPWANVQLRAENTARTLYNIVGFQTNLKWGEQKRVFSMIPGLEHAEFIRYGVMHRNTFLESPAVLTKGLYLKEHPNVFFAGQITGFEGYMESAASGLLAARNLYARLQGRELPPPPTTTMCGALIDYITTPNKDFQPMGANMGILPRTEEIDTIRDKRERYMALSDAAQATMRAWAAEAEH